MSQPESHVSSGTGKWKIGIAGIGRMGGAIAKRLLNLGHDVAVWNRSAGKTEALEKSGATKCQSAAELAHQVDFLITIVTDEAAIQSVYRSEQGVLSTPLAGKVVIEMSTLKPKAQLALAADVTANGAAFVECPVGGTVKPALSGNLLGFAGGSQEHFARARPVLEKLCRRVDYVGPVGAGASIKLAINLPLAIYWQVLGEAYVLCRHLDIDSMRLVELFSETSGAPNVLRVRGDSMADALSGKINKAPAFDCDLLRKDLKIMIEEAADQGIVLPLSERTLEIYDEASKASWGARDAMELATYWPNRK